MRWILCHIVLLNLIVIKYTTAQTTEKLYVSSPQSLPLYKTMAVSTTPFTKLQYGDTVTMLFYQDKYERAHYTQYNVLAPWQKIAYKGDTLYTSSAYLLPYPPPKQQHENFEAYFNSISKLATAPVENIYPTSTIDQFSIKKMLYQNGYEIHYYQAYESLSHIYFLPNISIEQAYVLAQHFKEFDLLKDLIFSVQYLSTTKEGTLKNGTHYVINTKAFYGDDSLDELRIEINTGGFFEYKFYYLYGSVVIELINYI